MAASAQRSVDNPQSFGRLWWLPSRGRGNGLDDASWAPIADVDASIVTPLRRQPAGRPRYRLWVGTSAYSQAEDLLRVRLPVLCRSTA